MKSITYKLSKGLKQCPYCEKWELHQHVVIIDKGITVYIKGETYTSNHSW